MIVNFFLFVISSFFDLLIFLLPKWSIWPVAVLDGINYFVSILAGLNFLLPVDTFFNAGLFLLSFEAMYFIAKLVVHIFNYIRGSGPIKI